MPMVIPLILSYVATTFIAVEGIGMAVMLVSSIALSSYQSSRAKAKARDQYNSAQVDRLANVPAAVAPRELVLGRVRKGGAVYFRGSAGSYRERFVAHLAIAGHEIDAVEQVYLNEVPVTLDSDGNVLTAPYLKSLKTSFGRVLAPGETSTVLDGGALVDGSISVMTAAVSDGENSIPPAPVPYTLTGTTLTLDRAYTESINISWQTTAAQSYARIWWELGSPTAVADATTIELFPGAWGTNHRAQGVAKLIALFDFNETAFPSGLPAISAVVRGAKVYDPRSATTAWSENPALLARHVYSSPYFGKGSVSSAEDTRFIAAANACDVSQAWVVSGGTDTQALYRASLVAPYGTPARDLLDDLCQSMAGIWALAGGELYLRAGVYTAPVMTLTDADLAVVQREGEREEQDAVSISVHRERAEKFNVVNLRIWDRAQDYKQVALTPLKSSALITRDGQELAQEMTLPGVFFAPQAQHIAGVTMRDARDPLVFEAPFKMSAYPLELFDTISVTLARYGWSAKTFMVIGRVWDRARGVVRLTMKETSAAIFTPDASFLPQGYSSNTALPKPYDINPPVLTSGGISSGTEQLVAQADGSYLTRVLVTWPQLTEASVLRAGQVELQWVDVGSETWHSVFAAGDDTQAYLVGPVDGRAIIIRARSKTTLATSDWSVQVVHVVVGKQAPPSAPSEVALTPTAVIFTSSPDQDVKGYRILYNVGTNTNRSVATQLHTGLVTVSPWALPIRLYGVNTILVVAVDVVGNESVATTDTQDLGQPDAANVADEVDYVADGFPGTVANATVTGGVLLADSDPSIDFYGAGSGSDIYFRDGADDIYGGSQYLSLVYTAEYTPPYAGGSLLLDLELVGVRSEVEVRVDGSTIGDVYDTARTDIYGTDIESIYGTPAEFRPWNGSIVPTVANITYQFRITIDAGSVQGEIDVMAVRTEMPQIDQIFGIVAVAAAGTQLTPSLGIPPRTFIAIEDVQITPIGGTAIAGRVKTYPVDPVSGPRVELIDSTATLVDGNAFVRLSGY